MAHRVIEIDNKAKGFYVTTPIYYVNDKPHIGHAYTTIAADIVARWHRLKGQRVFFLTGTDEHGEKIAKAAAASGSNPQEFVDGIVKQYKDAWEVLNISYDYFVRTTDKKHIEAVSKFLDILAKNGDVYKGEYEGWYCVSDETFFTDLQLKDGKCPECGKEVIRLKESTHFFRLSAYQDKLLDLYKTNTEFLSPKLRSEEIINRVKEGLKDISITRATVKWGVQFDNDHTVYVWVDALLNYISALDWPNGDKFGDFWPANVHIVGKEINWFHSVIWPAMLLSAGMNTPEKVFAHGWWTVDGKKMSKSSHNFVDPLDITKRYSVDALRYFLIRQMPFGYDGDFSESAMKELINSELLGALGNLVNRVLTLAENSKMSKFTGENELEAKINLTVLEGHMDAIELYSALNEIMEFVRYCNKYVNDKKPWTLEGKELEEVLYNLLESLRVISILLYPFIPATCEKIAQSLGTDKELSMSLINCKFRNEFGDKTSKGDLLFKKV
ncbi:MAG: methionine--tRNA ligase [Candidatus Micrarchaeaceae archaeon]